jgi:primosomal protein N' (replication factor Y) (superfamily II helicase)
LEAFRQGDVRILLGTQMIAKGLDFPNVTLVGVINADTALNWPDFRAAERTFHLVTQVAGRTGRSGRGGRVLVQTLDPEHPAIQAAVRHDYALFARDELPLREALGYPPFGSLARLIARGPVSERVEAFLSGVAERARAPRDTLAAEIRVVGPAPAPLAKLRGDYRFHLQMQSADREALHTQLASLRSAFEPPEGVQWAIDVDPVDML